MVNVVKEIWIQMEQIVYKQVEYINIVQVLVNLILFIVLVVKMVIILVIIYVLKNINILQKI